jgi:hypothetical protein
MLPQQELLQIWVLKVVLTCDKRPLQITAYDLPSVATILKVLLVAVSSSFKEQIVPGPVLKPAVLTAVDMQHHAWQRQPL